MAFFIQETEELGGNFLIYGQEGSGKTNLGKRFPSPTIIRTEKGVNEVGGMYSDPTSYNDLMTDLMYVYENGLPQGRKSLVLDSFTKMESLIHDEFLRINGLSELQDLGGKKMGGAYVWREAVMPYWIGSGVDGARLGVLTLLDAIKFRHQCNIVAICHNRIIQEKRVDTDSYNSEDLDLLNPKAVEAVRRWSDVNAFIYHPVNVINTTGNDKMKNNIGKSTNQKKIGLKRTAGWKAKIRDWGGRVDVANVPESIDYDLEGKNFFAIFENVLAK